MEEIIKLLSDNLSLKKTDCFGFDSMKVGPMKFQIEHWNCEALGNASHMNARAPLGLMTMQSVIINPSLSDMPLLSLDIVKAMGKYSVICEIYDTTLYGFDQTKLNKVKASLSCYEDIPQGQHWYDNIKMDCCMYKTCKKNQLSALLKGLCSYVDQYCQCVKSEKPFADQKSIKAKVKKNNEYVDGLLNNGGPSTDIFIKSIGKEKTSELFYKVLF